MAMWATIALSLVVILVLVCSLLFMTLLCPEWTSSYQYCAYEPCGCGVVVNMCFVHSAGSLVWPRWFRHRTLHFMSIHPVREIAETQKLSAATGSSRREFVSRCTGYKPNNVWSAPKHLRIHGYVIDAFYNERWAC